MVCLQSFLFYMQSYFQNKTVLVTGGSDGIGKALVAQLLEAGAWVATCGRTPEKVAQLQQQFAGKPLLAEVVDVTGEANCQKWIEATVTRFGGIDILINNAGISMRALFAEVELDTLRRLMDVNFWGVVYCTKFALPYIQKSRGAIVAISSIAGYRGLPGRVGYSASKFALNGFMEALRTELLPDGINVLWASPGFTASNIRKAALTKNGKPQGETPLEEEKLMTAEECATRILLAIAHKKRTLVMTAADKRTILVSKFLPALADKLVHKFFFKNGRLVK